MSVCPCFCHEEGNDGLTCGDCRHVHALARPCEGCGAVPGEPCREWCLSNVTGGGE